MPVPRGRIDPGPRAQPMGIAPEAAGESVRDPAGAEAAA